MREWINTSKETGYERARLAGMLFCFEVELHKLLSATSLAQERWKETERVIERENRIHGSGVDTTRAMSLIIQQNFKYFQHQLYHISHHRCHENCLSHGADNMKKVETCGGKVFFLFAFVNAHTTTKARENLKNERKEKQVFSETCGSGDKGGMYDCFFLSLFRVDV